MKTRKLLHETLVYYAKFGIALLLLTVPPFYYLYDKHYAHEMDELLLGRKEEFIRKSLQSLRADEIPIWNKFNDEDERILPDRRQPQEDVFAVVYVYDEQEGEKAPYRVLYSKIQIENQPYTLMLRLNIHEARNIFWSAILFQFAMFVGLMFGFVLITQLVYKKIWRPFYLTLRQVEAFNIRDSEVPQFPKTFIREFSQLNSALEKLASNNLQAYKTQKEFTENASHEMQTPLAIFQSKLDILIQQPRLSEEQLRLIQSLYDTASRLARMNKNLLLLAKMDNLQFMDKETLNIPQMLTDLLPSFEEQAESNGIRFQANINPENFRLQANKTLLEVLVNNLLTNAIKYNTPNGILSVSFRDRCLTVENTGLAKELDKTLLFRRFSRLHERTKGNGNGLGLAIVQQICLLNRWAVEYGYDRSRHKFSVIFSSLRA
jgi:signal transduction histidine kinase